MHVPRHDSYWHISIASTGGGSSPVAMWATKFDQVATVRRMIADGVSAGVGVAGHKGLHGHGAVERAAVHQALAHERAWPVAATLQGTGNFEDIQPSPKTSFARP